MVVQFNKQRSEINTQLPNHNLTYAKMPIGGYNGDALLNDLGYSNVEAGYTNATTVANTIMDIAE
jgi:hypothetical protein